MSLAPLASALDSDEVLVVVGAGGVGKTTISAALALHASLRGKRSIVCTIDPAKRLANALGLSEIGNTETRIAPGAFTEAGLPAHTPLYAMMLDMKRTWDELIEQRAAPDVREKILSNRFYQSLSTALAGSQEYIAMEKLWQLKSQRDYPFIVLDTPPTAHALDFLDAPNRVLDFLDNDAARWLLTPALAAGRVGLKLFNLGGAYVARQLAKFTGVETLQELAGFMLALSGLNQSFKERAQQTRALLASPTTGFVLVTTAAHDRFDEAMHFHTTLRQNHLKLAALVVNRVHIPASEGARAAAARLPADLRRKVEATLAELDALAEQDAQGIQRLREACAPTPVLLVPRFEVDVHDLRMLDRVGRFLVDESPPWSGRSLAAAASK